MNNTLSVEFVNWRSMVILGYTRLLSSVHLFYFVIYFTVSCLSKTIVTPDVKYFLGKNSERSIALVTHSYYTEVPRPVFFCKKPECTSNVPLCINLVYKASYFIAKFNEKKMVWGTQIIANRLFIIKLWVFRTNPSLVDVQDDLTWISSEIFLIFSFILKTLILNE